MSPQENRDQLPAPSGPDDSSSRSLLPPVSEKLVCYSLTRRDSHLLMLGSLAVVLLCILLNRSVLGGLPHGWDDASYYFQGQVFAGGRVTAPGTPLIDLFWINHVINRVDGRLSKYPPGWPALLAPAMFIGAPQLANALLAGLCVFFTSLTAACAFGRRHAFLVIPLALLSPFFSFMGATYLAHMACATGLAGLLYFMLRGLTSTRRKHVLLAGFAAGVFGAVALLSRPYSTFLGCMGCAIIGLLAAGWRDRRWLMLIPAIAAPLLLAGLGFLCYNAATTGSPWVTGYNAHDARFSFIRGLDNRADQTLWTNLQSHLPKFLIRMNQHIWGWPYLPDLLFLPVGMLLNIRRPLVWAFPLAVAFYLTGFSIYWYFDVYFGPRLAFETMPYILIATAVGMLSLWDRCCSLSKTVRIFIGAGTALLLIASSLSYYAERSRYYSLNYCGQGREVLQKANIAQLDNALVFISGPPYVYANFYFLNELDLKRSPVVYARYNPERIAAAMAYYPRKQTLILDVDLQPIEGPDGYADRFILKSLQWLNVENAP